MTRSSHYFEKSDSVSEFLEFNPENPNCTDIPCRNFSKSIPFPISKEMLRLYVATVLESREMDNESA